MTPGASIPPQSSEGSGSPAAGAASRRGSGSVPGQEPKDRETLQPEGGVVGAAAPHAHPVPRAQRTRDPRKGLRGLEREAVDREARSVRDREPDVAAPEADGRSGHDPLDDAPRVGGNVGRRSADEVVPRALVGAKKHPPIDRLGPDRAEGSYGRLGIRGPESVKDRTRGVRGDEETSGAWVPAQEQRRIPRLRGRDAPGIDTAKLALASRGPVGEELPGRVSPRPGEARRGADQAPLASLGTPPRAGRREQGLDVRDRDDLPDGSPVEGGRGPPGRHYEGRVGPDVARARGAHQSAPREVEELHSIPSRDRSPRRERPDRPSPDLGEAAPRPLPPAEVDRERGVPAGLPWDVGVQADEPGLPDEIEPELPSERDELRQRKGGAAAPRTIGVVDADPDGPPPSGGNGPTPFERIEPGPRRARRGASGRPAGSSRGSSPRAPARASSRRASPRGPRPSRSPSAGA